MMQTVSPQYVTKLPPDTVKKLEYSRRRAEVLIKREIKCPVCGFHLLEVYGRDHHITRVKCQKCKFNEFIDTALFRTIKIRKSDYCEELCSQIPIR